MDRRLALPAFSKAPATYDPVYFQDLVRMLNNLTTVITNPGTGRQTSMVFTGLFSDDYGLEPGGVFQVNGALRVSILPTAYVRGVNASGSIGSVSVTVV